MDGNDVKLDVGIGGNRNSTGSFMEYKGNHKPIYLISLLYKLDNC